MSLLKKGIKFIGLLSLSISCLWAEEYFPKGCRPISVSDAKMDIKVKPNHILFFHNLSNKQIWLANRHYRQLTRGLAAERWSALYAPNTELTWRCIQSEQGHEQHVACQEVIGVCSWAAKAPTTMRKVKMQWLLENQNVAYGKAYLQRMGWLFNQKRSKLKKTVS
jgi:hypothetical protein